MFLTTRGGSAGECLDREQCIAKLGANTVGRVAVCIDALPAIFPVVYRLVGGEIVFAVDGGSRFHGALRAGAVVGFELDGHELASDSDWIVQVVGRTAELSGSGALAVQGRIAKPADGSQPRRVITINPEIISGTTLPRAA